MKQPLDIGGIALFYRPMLPHLNFLLVIAVLLTMSGCGVRRVISPVDQGYPTDISPSREKSILQPYSSGPGNGLYVQAEESLSQGQIDQAELALERALRIEPGNPAYWYTMGKIKFLKNSYTQAIQFCLKSKSLAGRNNNLIRMNDILISKAQKQSHK